MTKLEKLYSIIQTLSIEIPISVYKSIDYGSKDKNIISENQAFPFFSFFVLIFFVLLQTERT